MTYDAKCWDLAQLFLEDEPPELNTDSNRDELAKAIQQAIEDEIAAMKSKLGIPS